MIVVDALILKLQRQKEMKAVLDNLKVAKALVVVDEAAANAILSVEQPERSKRRLQQLHQRI